MREIKFRAWNRNECKMIDLQKITPLALNDSMNTQLKIRGESGLFLPFIEYTELMQYTGLKDKNDKEIYEGDILADTGCPDEYYTLGKVAYCDTPDCIYAGQFYLQDIEGYASDWDGVEPENWHGFEVIGNIYKNPELLKEGESK